MDLKMDDIETTTEIELGEYSPDKISDKFDKCAEARGISSDEMLAQAIQKMMYEEEPCHT